MLNHRKMYQDCTGQSIPDGYEIHHLNGKHYDNFINNLICIEKFKHRNYHKCLVYCWEIISHGKSERLAWFEPNEIEMCTKIINDAVELRECLKESVLKAGDDIGRAPNVCENNN